MEGLPNWYGPGSLNPRPQGHASSTLAPSAMTENLTGLQLSKAQPEAVRAEMERSIESSEARDFFNNFQFRFGRYRDISEATKTMDQPHAENGFSEQRGNSALFVRQTPREFFGQVDSVAQSCGYSPEKAREIADGKDNRFYKVMAPAVFMKLIEMGYNYLDLTT